MSKCEYYKSVSFSRGPVRKMKEFFCPRKKTGKEFCAKHFRIMKLERKRFDIAMKIMEREMPFKSYIGDKAIAKRISL